MPVSINAVLRRCAREGQPLIDEVQTQTLDVPPWLMARWTAHYGEVTARAIALALSHEPSLDLTVKSDAAQWAARLHGVTLPTGTVRTLLHGPVTMLPGFADGQWWVQDAAAALPARLFGNISGKGDRGSLRRAGRQNRATRARRRCGHGNRSFARSRGPAAR